MMTLEALANGKKEYLAKLSRFRRLGVEAEGYVLVMGVGECSSRMGNAIAKRVKTRIVLSGMGEFERSLLRFLKNPVIWICRNDASDVVLDETFEVFPFPTNQIDDALVARTRRQIFVGRSKRITRAKKFATDLSKRPIWIR